MPALLTQYDCVLPHRGSGVMICNLFLESKRKCVGGCVFLKREEGCGVCLPLLQGYGLDVWMWALVMWV